MKRCTGCEVEKPLDSFWRDNRRPEGRLSRCKTCKTAATNRFRKEQGYDKTRYWRNPEGERERHLIRKYGVTLTDYNAMFKAQGGACAVCRRTQERAFDVDHCHETGRVRGLLCTGCNRMIGHAGDRPATLRAAADYLEAP